MSLPTTTKPVQPSILSFFTPSASSSRHVSPPPPPPPPPPPQQQRQQEQQQQDHHQKKPPVGSRNAKIPPEASIRVPTSADLAPLRRINALLLQVSYPDSFYASVADNPLSRVITWAHDGEDAKVVGGIVCRVESEDGGPGPATNIYIRSLCLLSPYRSMGLARAALEDLLAGAAPHSPGLVAATAHVWTDNEDGLRWYERQGFERVGSAPIPGYYLRLRPDTAWLVRRAVSHRAAADPPPRGASVRPPPPPKSVTAAVVNARLPPAVPSRPRPPPGQSFQNQRPETEWNDLPADMAPPMVPLRKAASEPATATAPSAQRSVSAATRKKRDRSYPAAAFGAN